jgi:whirlin
MRDHHQMSHSIPNIHQLSTRTIHLKRSDSTKANNLSLPLNKTSQQHHSSNSHHNSKTTSKDQHLQQQANKDDPNHNGFGICIKGNKTAGRGVFISKVENGSTAYQNGLRVGDSILEINGQPFTSMNHEEAVKKCTQILKAEKFCSMTVRSPELATMKYNSFDESQLHQYPRDEELYIPLANEMHAGGGDSGSIHSAPPQKVGCIWIDRHGRSVSPPHEYSHRRDKMDRVRRIDLLIQHGESLGLMIRGGIEYGLGIFVTGVDKDSVAERSGLMVSFLEHL